MLNQKSQDLAPLGMTLLDGGGVFGVWSSTASAVKLLILDPEDTSEVLHEIPLEEQQVAFGPPVTTG